MTYRIFDWRGNQASYYSTADEAERVALAISHATDEMIKIVAPDGWFRETGMLPNGEWTLGKYWQEPAG